jgi:signal transduction histidine kinase/CheY-like chemotaxis protein
MPAAPLPPDESRRLAALLQCRVLDTAPETGFDDLTQLAAELCETPIALVSLVAESRQWFMSRVGLPVTETPRDHAFCGYAILADEPLVIPDATRDPRTADNPLVTGEPGIRFYAGVPLRLSTGEAVGTLCVIDLEPRDLAPPQLVTLRRLAGQAASQLELRRTVTELEAATRRAEEADRLKSTFLANMSHEIRTPMTAILGHADLLQEPDLAADPAHVARASASIRRSGRHLLGIINDILDLSKVEAGRLEVEQIPTDTEPLVREAIDIVRPAADARGLTVDLDPASEIPASIRTDPTRLCQVIVNLLGNAVKFTETGSVRVLLRCDRASERLSIGIIDTGIGMTEEQRQRIARFEPFIQADQSTTRTHGGTGLGLRISHLITEALGGHLDVTSTPGEGSTFTATVATGPLTGVSITTPATADTDADVDVDASPPAPPTPPTPKSGGHRECPLANRHVLLAEDGPENQVLIRFHLERAGARVTVAENGQVVLDHLLHRADPSAPPVDLVLMDMQMPVMDGYEATRTLRAAGCVLPIVAVTAHAMAGDEQQCLDAGCSGYLSKPIRGGVLIDTCVEAIATPHRAAA